MDKRLPDRSGPDAITVHQYGIRGVHVFHKRQIASRAPEPCCKGTIVGYTQCITMHDGNNPLLGERQAWVTHVAHKPKLTINEQHVVGNVHVYLIRPDDLITSITVAQSELCLEDTDRPTAGLWQIIAFHRPGIRGELYLPRLLVPFVPMRTPPVSRLQ